ncbi:hypothetical protein DE146DRAFT_146542 [Phaeosphaeria sp. MPI-PUGE-AT-0046c]|nr:hypothetical protein DE146DRAFT_146542 [Phaeosphaeria sp. MPI-PUGE-AT-0046c]
MATDYNPANDATAQTLNYALGNLGGGTRSWMHPTNFTTTPASLAPPAGPLPAATPAARVPRRRGRPPKKLATVPPPNTATAQSPIEPQTDRQPSSTSASPHLANILTAHDRRPPATVFPSPTPSEENTPLPGVSAAGALDFFSFDAAHTDGAVNSPSGAATDAMARGISHSKRLSTDMGAQAAKRPHLGRDEHARSTTMSGGASVQHASISRPQSTDSLRSLSNQAPSTRSPHFELMRPQGSVPGPNSPLYAQGGPVDPRNTLARHRASTSLSTPGRTGDHASPPTTWYTARQCLQLLDAFELSRGGAQASLQVDRRRLDVLRTAIEKEDWAYLIFHQIYCLHDVQFSALPEQLRAQATLPQALHLLQTVLDDNKKLSDDVRLFFAEFPYSLHTIYKMWPAGFHEQLAKFSFFMFSSQHYGSLRANCRQRRFPPLAWELVDHLALDSQILQGVLFRSVLRCIWQAVPANEARTRYEQQAVNIFHENQRYFFDRRAKRGEQGVNHPDQLRYGNERDTSYWGPKLLQVTDACEFNLGGHGHLASSQLNALQHQQRQPQHMQQQHILQQQRQQTQQQTMLLQQSMPSPASQMALRSQFPSQVYSNQSRRPEQLRIQPVPPSIHLPSQSRLNAPLLPKPGVQLPQQRQPDPARFSLHQAHLRSPVPKARSLESPLYLFVEGFLNKPTRLSTANRAIERWSFTLPADMIQAVATTIPGAPGQVGHKLVDKNSKILRLRSIKWTSSNRPEDHVWATANTSWIPYSCFKLNGFLLEQRKKVHHGKDLPIDITNFVHDGENILEIMVTTNSADKSFLDYLVAIEFLGITCHESLKRNCLEDQFKPSEEILAKLMTKLSSTSSEDDDIAIVESKLTINLFDPFSASRICDIPVRSRICLHNDCFDLETFLSTRRRKGDVCDPDLWRCPICNADARPQYLITDGFLVNVKNVLDAQGLSQTRAIVVHQDGSWRQKAEVRDPNGVSDDPPTPTVRRASEVIDLSD